MLNEQQTRWFSALTAKRETFVRVLDGEGVLDIFISHIVDTYRESAHFILELLQNADDVQAKNVRFELRKDGIVFAHNGKVGFSISDPLVERNPNVVPGHINAITTFSLSTKKEDIENKIGKFGIGFKSVFQYTSKPFVNNPPFNFTIENFMIPRRVANPKTYIKGNETTAFWLPFDKTDITASESYSEIADKLESLKNPLLFLHSLERVEIITNEFTKVFTKDKKNISIQSADNVVAQKITLNEDNLLCFSQKVNILDREKKSHLLTINCGFVLDNDGKITNEVRYRHYFKNAWCFFPTQQETNLSYIVNAPFILTPNREAIKEDRIENKQIVVLLGNLFEIALQNLKTLGYINEEFFTTIPNPVYLPANFKIIGDKIINKLRLGEFIPTKEKDFIAISNSFVCTEPLLAELLSYNNYGPLRVITGKPHARIVFRERKLFHDQNLFVYFYKTFSAEQLDLQATWLGAKYHKALLEKLPQAFIINFFNYLNERSNQVLAKGQPLWGKPFIPVHNADVATIVQPNNPSGHPQVFIGGAKIKGRLVLKEYLAKNEELRPFFESVLKFSLPDDFDDFMLSLEKYSDEGNKVSIDEAAKDFQVIKKYLSETTATKKGELISKLREIDFLPCIGTDGIVQLVCPFNAVAYYPSKTLKEYFSKSSTSKNWVYLDKLQTENEDMQGTLVELDIEFSPYYNTSEKTLDEVNSFLVDITLDESLYLSNLLIASQSRIDFKKELPVLKTSDWLFDSDGVKRKPNEIELGDLHLKYSTFFDAIHIALGAVINNTAQRYAGLNDKEKALLEAIAPSLTELSPDEIKAALANLIKEKNARNESKGKEGDKTNEEDVDDTTTPEGLLNSWIKEPLEHANKAYEDQVVSGEKIPKLSNSSSFDENEIENEVEENQGELVSAPVVGGQYKNDKQDKKKAQLEKEIELDIRRNQLIELANQFEHYSFGWFKTLLELEDNFTAEDRLKRNPINVVFGKAHLDEDGLLILSDTPFIPPTIDDLVEISIQLFFEDDKKTIKGEIVSPQKSILKVKLSNQSQIAGVDLSTVSRAVVNSSSADFILERLKNAFRNLRFDDDTTNLKSADVLPKNLKFIFGPPGTGKTTYLSWLIGGKCPHELKFNGNSIEPLMEQKGKRVLVLTPTNKAADVLTARILKNYQDANDYPSWLIRFGQSITLENDPVFVGNRILPQSAEESCTLITTIARFPYDYFKIDSSEGEDYFLKDFGWDYIVFDEASMIQQAALLYAVFYARQINPKVEFFIGGDPFQIPPIFQFEFPYWSYLPEPAFDNNKQPILDENGKQFAWKQDGGNIYSFVELSKDDSFTNPVTKPHKFEIQNLSIQFRSILPIGELYSHYRYGGKLDTHRKPEAISRNEALPENPIEVTGFPLSPITIINFPVKKYGSVYKQQAIKGSPFQIYSAIFTVELIRYIQANSKSKNYKIGVISPYGKQNLLVSKLLEKVGNGNIEIVCGTVHGFQGDECDMVIVVFNPPKNIKRNPRCFLNKKNILNVAISRARDKMVILCPYDPDKEINIHDLHQINWIKTLAKKLPNCSNHVTELFAVKLENDLWNKDCYIEETCFTATHQEVNIYTTAAKRYEIRVDENAIDVQVRTGKPDEEKEVSYLKGTSENIELSTN